LLWFSVSAERMFPTLSAKQRGAASKTMLVTSLALEKGAREFRRQEYEEGTFVVNMTRDASQSTLKSRVEGRSARDLIKVLEVHA
jgi:hypothetical protein